MCRRRAMNTAAKKVLVASLHELRTPAAQKLPIEVRVMGDASAPTHLGGTDRIEPKTGGKQFAAFDKFSRGVRDGKNDYVHVTASGAKLNEKMAELVPGRWVRITNYAIASENQKFYAPPLGFSINVNKATIVEIPEPANFPTWRVKVNIASILAKVSERKTDVAGKVIHVSEPRPKKEGSPDMVADVVVLDNSKHKADLAYWDKSCEQLPSVGQHIVLENVVVKVTGGSIRGLWVSPSNKSKWHVMPTASVVEVEETDAAGAARVVTMVNEGQYERCSKVSNLLHKFCNLCSPRRINPLMWVNFGVEYFLCVFFSVDDFLLGFSWFPPWLPFFVSCLSLVPGGPRSLWAVGRLLVVGSALVVLGGCRCHRLYKYATWKNVGHWPFLRHAPCSFGVWRSPF